MFGVCGVEKREDLHKLIISALDFSWDGCARAIMNRLLTGGSPQMRLYATKHLRVLLRARSPMFKSWGMEILTTQVGRMGGGCRDFPHCACVKALYACWVAVVLEVGGPCCVDLSYFEEPK